MVQASLTCHCSHPGTNSFVLIMDRFIIEVPGFAQARSGGDKVQKKYFIEFFTTRLLEFFCLAYVILSVIHCRERV